MQGSPQRLTVGAPAGIPVRPAFVEKFDLKKRCTSKYKMQTATY